MEVQGWKKITAIFVIIAFIGVGMVWAAEQDGPRFQEKAGTPVVKKQKKFPWLIVLLGTAAIGVGVYFLARKKDKEEPQPNPLPKDYTVKILNIMNKDVQRTVTFSAVPGTTKAYTASDLSIAGVYDKYIVVRVEGSNNELGEWLAFGKDKSVSFKTPTNNTTLCAYFFENMDNGRNDLYDKMFTDENINAALGAGRNSLWYRFDADGRSGPQSVWDHAAAQLNTALSYAFKVGSVSTTGGTKYKYGYRNCGGADGTKSFTEFWIGVDSDKLGVNQTIPLERTALEEWFEYETYSNNIDDRLTQSTICDPLKSDMNMTGYRLIRAVFTASKDN